MGSNVDLLSEEHFSLAVCERRKRRTSPAVCERRKRRTSPADLIDSADLIGTNADLLSEILLLLPAKSLFKFKVVSPQWNQIISNKCLLSRWVLRREHEHSFIVRYHYGPEYSYVESDELIGISYFYIIDPTANEFSRFNFPLDFPCIKILQSTHGLLLVHCRNWQMNHFYVFNPTTMESRLIHSNNSRCFTKNHFYLIFDPGVSENYKVVSFIKTQVPGMCFGDCTIQFSVYDSATHTWSKEEGSFPEEEEGSLEFDDSDYSFQFPAGLYHEGGVYFIREGISSLRYSPEENRLRKVPCPPRRKGDVLGRSKYFVVQSNGHLHCLQLHYKDKKKRYHAVVLEMVENEWILCRRSDGSKLKLKLGVLAEVQLVGMIRKEMIEDSVFVFHVAGGRVIKFGFGDERGEVVVGQDKGKDINLSKCRGRLKFDHRKVRSSWCKVIIEHGSIDLCHCGYVYAPVLEEAHPFIHSFTSV